MNVTRTNKVLLVVSASGPETVVANAFGAGCAMIVMELASSDAASAVRFPVAMTCMPFLSVSGIRSSTSGVARPPSTGRTT